MVGIFAGLVGRRQNDLNDHYDFLDGLSAEELERHMRGMQVVTFSTVASLMFLVYDVSLTFGDEVQYIWALSWSLTKTAFYFIRYFPIIFLFSIQFYGTPYIVYSHHACYIWNAYQAVATILVILGVDYILLLRVFALYHENRTIKALTLALYAMELLTMSVGMGLAIPHLTFDRFCGVVDAPVTFLIAAAIPILFQTYLFTITTYKFVRAVKAGWGDVPILKIVMRDSVWAFVLLFFMLVAEAFLYGLAEDAYIGILYGWLNAVFSFCGYRILININKAGRVQRGRTTASTDHRIEFMPNISAGAASHDVSSGGGSHDVSSGGGSHDVGSTSGATSLLEGGAAAATSADTTESAWNLALGRGGGGGGAGSRRRGRKSEGGRRGRVDWSGAGSASLSRSYELAVVSVSLGSLGGGSTSTAASRSAGTTGSKKSAKGGASGGGG